MVEPGAGVPVAPVEIDHRDDPAEAGCSEDAAKAIERSPKTEAVAQAERELDGKGWLPSPLLTPGAVQADATNREHDDGDDEAQMPMAAE